MEYGNKKLEDRADEHWLYNDLPRDIEKYLEYRIWKTGNYTKEDGYNYTGVVALPVRKARTESSIKYNGEKIVTINREVWVVYIDEYIEKIKKYLKKQKAEWGDGYTPAEWLDETVIRNEFRRCETIYKDIYRCLYSLTDDVKSLTEEVEQIVSEIDSEILNDITIDIGGLEGYGDVGKIGMCVEEGNWNLDKHNFVADLVLYSDKIREIFKKKLIRECKEDLEDIEFVFLDIVEEVLAFTLNCFPETFDFYMYVPKPVLVGYDDDAEIDGENVERAYLVGRNDENVHEIQ